MNALGKWLPLFDGLPNDPLSEAKWVTLLLITAFASRDPKMPSTSIILGGSFFSQDRWIHIFTKHWIAKSLFLLNIIGLFCIDVGLIERYFLTPFFAEVPFLN